MQKIFNVPWKSLEVLLAVLPAYMFLFLLHFRLFPSPWKTLSPCSLHSGALLLLSSPPAVPYAGPSLKPQMGQARPSSSSHKPLPHCHYCLLLSPPLLCSPPLRHFFSSPHPLQSHGRRKVPALPQQSRPPRTMRTVTFGGFPTVAAPWCLGSLFLWPPSEKTDVL